MGKSTRETPQRVDTKDLYQLPYDFTLKYKHLTLAIDILFFDTIPFLLTISRDIHFYTVEKLNDRENSTILECLKRVISMYNARGFFVQYIMADGEFRHMTGDIISAFKCHLNCTSAGEHVPEAVCAIRVIKERIRCIVTTWPFKMVPQSFKISLMKFVIFWLNAIPQANSIIPNICSKAILTGQFPDFNKHCKIGFGTYAHVHTPRTITNTMAPRTTPAIALGPMSTIQGGHRFFCLQTKRIITRRQWTDLPMPDTVISLIHEITMKERKRMKKAVRKQSENTPEYTISHISQSDADASSNTIQEPDVPAPIIDNDVAPVDQINNALPSTTSINDADNNESEVDTLETEDDSPNIPNITDEADESKVDQIDERDAPQAESSDDSAPVRTYNTRSSKPHQYDKVYGADYTFAVALTQMSATRGIKKFG